ncbi:MAG: hypothetical protein ACAH17_02600 [Candidatus Paceibacterota bacterium]
MLRLLSAVLLSIFVSVCLAEPEEKEVNRQLGQLVYTQLNITKKTTVVGVWKFTTPPDEESVIVEKNMTGNEVDEVEIVTQTSRTTILKQIGITSREVFFKPIREMKHGEKSIGMVEWSNTNTKEVLFKWPMFYNVQIREAFVTVMSDTFMSDGLKMQVTREFVHNQPFAPTMERFVIINGDGTIKSELIYARKQ